MKKILFKIFILVALLGLSLGYVFTGDWFMAIALFVLLVACIVALVQWISLPKEIKEKSILWVQESSLGLWYYHITQDGKPLCGTTIDLLNKKLPMENWGIVSSHIHERYCKKCNEIYKTLH